jgi:hypothetical protein
MTNLVEEDVLTLDGPFLVLSCNNASVYAKLIQLKTGSCWNHAMWLYEPGWLASQGWVFRKVPMTKFLPGHALKFWHNPDWTEKQKGALRRAVEEQLLERGVYDWVGILGQLTGMRSRLNKTDRNYCSEAVAEVLRVVEPHVKRHPSPADLDLWCRSVRQMKCYGVYLPCG